MLTVLHTSSEPGSWNLPSWEEFGKWVIQCPLIRLLLDGISLSIFPTRLIVSERPSTGQKSCLLMVTRWQIVLSTWTWSILFSSFMRQALAELPGLALQSCLSLQSLWVTSVPHYSWLGMVFLHFLQNVLVKCLICVPFSSTWQRFLWTECRVVLRDGIKGERDPLPLLF